MVIWFIGLSRAGKTTLSKLLYKKLKPNIENLVLLDGDNIRNLFKNDIDHSLEGRYKNAERLAKESISLPIDPNLSSQKIKFITKTLNEF